MVARAVVAVTAVLALAWLAVMERDVRLEARGAAALRSEGEPAVLARAETDLRRANLLNPGTGPDLNRALVRRARGRTEQSVALLEDVLRREPENVTAWRILRCSHRKTGGRSLAAQRRLDPLNARRPLRRRSASTIRAPASTIAGSDTAGSCQSQSIDAWRNQTSSAAAGPAAAAACARNARRAASAHAAEHHPERDQSRQAELGGDLDLERVRVPHRLGDRALAQPFDAEPGGAHTSERAALERREADPPVLVAVRADRRQAPGLGAGAELSRGRPLTQPRGDEAHRDRGHDDRRRRARAARECGSLRSGPARERAARYPAPAASSTIAPSAIAPSRSGSEPSSAATPGRAAATAAAAAPAASASAEARSWPYVGAAATSIARPSTAPASAPRE